MERHLTKALLDDGAFFQMISVIVRSGNMLNRDIKPNIRNNN